MSKQLTTIDFHGSKLFAIAGDRPETTLVAMKPIVEGMGLAWQTQHRKISSHPVLSKGVTMMVIPPEAKGISVTETPAEGGRQSVTCLSLDLLNFWLATIHPDRIKDQTVRARVIEYQTECARVLFNHFFGKAIAAGGHLNAQQTGGIFKAGLGKLKRELLAEIAPQLSALAEELRTIHRPVGVAVVTHRTAKRWLDHYGITKRPKGLALRVSNALARQSIRMGYAVSYTAEEEKRTFHEVVANAYFTVGAGRHLLPKAVRGQKEMGLETTSTPFTKTPA
ncbi:MAG: phage antirepressor N-terminal domain-containing protein [Acetobacter malorum]|uniref:phage antirepressor N-terminal domain-containing protein n=1 Tax=Acetobacter malorum TaxID=178901 RepID=UPI0039E9E3DE